MRPIGRVRTCYPEKFGVPRQAGLAPSATAELYFEPEFQREEAVRGLEGFSHVWLTFLFHLVPEEETRLSVRPPRLGGNERLGVFATRSPFRPNRLGLSVVRVTGIRTDDKCGPVLELSGIDLVDGTPILDVRPYLPYADALPNAVGGFASGAPERVPVEVEAGCVDAFAALPEVSRRVVRETLALDPRPRYHDEGDRDYVTAILDHEVVWCFREGKVFIRAIR